MLFLNKGNSTLNRMELEIQGRNRGFFFFFFVSIDRQSE